MICRLSAIFLMLFCGAVSAFPQATDMDPGVPVGNAPCFVVHHTAYSLCYSEPFEQAEWVMYKLTREEVASEKASRKDADFQPDPDVPTGSATKDDYRNSGYDKGHLAPAADMKWNARAMRESFYLSNVSPQLHDFNAGVWEDLENGVRQWAERLGEVYVVTGPVLTPGLPTIGPDHVAVPRYFYKVILYRSATAAEAIGFVMQNAASYLPVENYAVSVDSVESATGLDFFAALPSDLQEKAESHVDKSWWFTSAEVPKTHPKKHRTHKHK